LPGMSVAKDRPERILIVSLGSRGDVQPYIALGKALLAAGYEVVIGSSANHKTIVESFGVPFFGTFLDVQQFLEENGTMKEAMAQGNVVKFTAGFGEGVVDNAVLHYSKFKEVMNEFKPDLVICGMLVDNYCASTLFYYDIPVFILQLNYTPPSPKRMTLGLPNLPFGLNAWVMQNIIMAGMWDGIVKADKVAGEVAGHKITEMIKWRFLIVEEADDPNVIPRLMAMPSKWAEAMYPGHKPSVKFVGSMALTAVEQEEVASSNVRTDFGYAGELERVRAFVAAGTKPIFLGWGSMTCRTPEHMMQLVAMAVKLSGYRAIIQAGWAKLSFELLKSCVKDKSLVEYAEQNVLFIGDAPHEWLFPQCACTVHHGGAGTTTCCLRAGTPPVITPVFMDQFDHAHMVNALGVGVGFEKKQFHKISAKELSNAIVKCVSSDDIRARAAEMSVAMHSQNGVKNAVAYVEEFWANEVRTGRQRRLAQEVLRQMKTPQRSSTCTCCGR